MLSFLSPFPCNIGKKYDSTHALPLLYSKLILSSNVYPRNTVTTLSIFPPDTQRYSISSFSSIPIPNCNSPVHVESFKWCFFATDSSAGQDHLTGDWRSWQRQAGRAMLPASYNKTETMQRAVVMVASANRTQTLSIVTDHIRS